MSECIERRYPRTERTARAVWRGTNTDSHGADRLTAVNWLRNLRVQLVLRAANMSHIADFGLTHLWIGALPNADLVHHTWTTSALMRQQRENSLRHSYGDNCVGWTRSLAQKELGRIMVHGSELSR